MSGTIHRRYSERVARGEIEAHLGRALVLVRLRGLVGCYKHLIGGDLIGAPGGGRR